MRRFLLLFNTNTPILGTTRLLTDQNKIFLTDQNGNYLRTPGSIGLTDQNGKFLRNQNGTFLTTT